MAKQSAFPGFSRDLIVFFRELEQHNEKAWFDQHRQEYQALLMEPAKQFVAAVGAQLQRMSRDIHAEPRVNGSIMRINRDIRFSNDKRPYKTNLAMMFPERPEFDKGAAVLPDANRRRNALHRRGALRLLATAVGAVS